jgi:hypothetical protein
MKQRGDRREASEDHVMAITPRLNIRFEDATDPRDKVYGLAGLSLGEGLLQTADCNLLVN